MRGPIFSLVYGNKFTTNNIPSQKGKVIIVTGGNGGIGYETTKELYAKGAKVYVASRSQSKAEAAITKIKQEVVGADVGSLEFLELDLMSLESTKAAADAFIAAEPTLDVLINNAGIMAVDYKLTKDGCDQQLQTNHIAPFLFTNLLLPKFKTSKDPRIVNVSSIAHQRYYTETEDSFASFEVSNGDLGGQWQRYGQSKIANVLFAQELAKRHPEILSNSCHPGIIASDLYNHLGFMSTMIKGFAAIGAGLNTADGALTQLYLATSPEIASSKISGQYYVPLAKRSTASSAANEKCASRLWILSEKFLADKGYSLTS